MKVALASDLHLEFGTIELENTESADVLILAGDICQAVDVNNDTTWADGARPSLNRSVIVFLG
jgi:predicted phosphodiesterase